MTSVDGSRFQVTFALLRSQPDLDVGPKVTKLRHLYLVNRLRAGRMVGRHHISTPTHYLRRVAISQPTRCIQTGEKWLLTHVFPVCLQKSLGSSSLLVFRIDCRLGPMNRRPILEADETLLYLIIPTTRRGLGHSRGVSSSSTSVDLKSAVHPFCLRSRLLPLLLLLPDAEDVPLLRGPTGKVVG